MRGPWMQRLRTWCRDLFRRRVLDAELDEEIRYHLEREIEEHIAAGHTPEEARRRALADFGALPAIKEEVRETRATQWIESLWLDARYGARALRRNPLFTLTAVVTLALSIGAVTTLLSVAHAFFLRPLPVREPDRVVEVSATRDHGTRDGFVSYPDYARFRDGAATLQGLAAAYLSAPLFVTTDDEAELVSGAVVTASFFPLLGIEPEVGRFFTAEEDDVPGRDAVIVVSHDLWASRFGAEPRAIGERLEINGVSFTIIGVVPPQFHGIGTTAPQIYMPAMMLPVGYRWCAVLSDQDCTILRMFGRLADGVGIGAARAEMTALAPERWSAAPPGDNSGVAVKPVRGAATDVGDTTRRFLQLFAVVAGALLLVCCANLAGLLLARSGRRARELAIRTSLGAPAARLLRQMLTESSLLALAGGAVGVALSLVLTRWFDAAFYATDLEGGSYYVDFSPAPVVVAAVVALALLCGVLFGALPAIASVRLGSAADTLRRRATSLGAARGGRWLLAAQAAAAVVFVVVAGLLSSSAAVLLRGANFDPQGVALMRLRPRLVGYGAEQGQAFVRQAVARLEAMPEVESVTMVGTGVALAGFTAGVSLPDHREAALEAGYIEVGPRYFETLRTPVLRGRELDRGDDLSAPAVALVNETLANTLWPRGDALGAELVVDGRRYTVVGIVADVPLHDRGAAQQPYVYTAYWQNPEQVDARLQIRVRGEPAALLPRLAREVARVDAAVPIAEMLTLSEQVAEYVRPQRMGAAAVGYAAGLAVLLSAMGLYAALAAGVAARRHELGVRMAVGAGAGDIFRLIVGQGSATTAAGVVAGLGGAAAAARLLQHLLYGSSNGDWRLFVGAALAVSLGGIGASLIPALRAARTAPTRALQPD